MAQGAFAVQVSVKTELSAVQIQKNAPSSRLHGVGGWAVRQVQLTGPAVQVQPGRMVSGASLVLQL